MENVTFDPTEALVAVTSAELTLFELDAGFWLTGELRGMQRQQVLVDLVQRCMYLCLSSCAHIIRCPHECFYLLHQRCLRFLLKKHINNIFSNQL